MPLPLCPQCDSLACVLFQHPQQHSLRLQGLGSWCKVNHSGGREDGERKRETERDRERAQPYASYHPLEHVAETLHGCKKRKCVCFQYRSITISSWSCDTSICLNGTNGFWHEQQACSVFYFLLVMSHKTNLFSTSQTRSQNTDCDGWRSAIWGLLEHRELFWGMSQLIEKVRAIKATCLLLTWTDLELVIVTNC